MLHSVRLRQTIGRISKEFSQRRVIVASGTVETVTFSAQSDAGIMRVWIPESIVFFKAHQELVWIVF
jgi:hypothetical protein